MWPEGVTCKIGSVCLDVNLGNALGPSPSTDLESYVEPGDRS
jgi:hypothetical protein